MSLSRRRFITDVLAAGIASGVARPPLSLAKAAVPGGNFSLESKDWTLGPFQRVEGANPCLTSFAGSTFECPVRKEKIHWEDKDVLCAAAVVRSGKVHMLYRAEDKLGGLAGKSKTAQGWGTSRIGLAFSEDGQNFTRHPTPVLYPDDDFMKRYEWDGGCQDPRIVEDDDGVYYMTYTAFDGKLARLAVASSPDLIHWKKHGLAFDKAYGGKYRDSWSKSGAIVARREGARFVATRINGKYWMYFGDSNTFVATSPNLIDWEPLQREDGELRYAFGPRKGSFDSEFTEPGPFGLLTEKGILLIYNSTHKVAGRDIGHENLVYCAGQILLDPKDPTRVLDRTSHDFFHPELEWEVKGQTANVVFIESLVLFNQKWFIYYGAADSRIGVASYKQ
jgi:beta-1,2-mannosidase